MIFAKRNRLAVGIKCRYLKSSMGWIWSTSNQPNSMIQWFWHHFAQKGTLGLADSQPFSWVKARPGIYQQFASITWCFAGKGGERWGFGLQEFWMVSTQSAATTAVISANGLWRTQQFAIDIAREAFSGNVIQVLAAIDSRFQRLWSSYRVVLYICTCI